MIYAEQWAFLLRAPDAPSLLCLIWNVQQSDNELRHSMEEPVGKLKKTCKILKQVRLVQLKGKKLV